MAVVKNFWLRDNKQKLGGAVIYQANGQTLMRQLAPSVSNPRTDAQMETRVKLANLVAFYRASSKWMRGAFESKPNNQSDYNAFVSANASGNNVWLSKSQVDAGNAIVAPYIVSRGSLGEITQVVDQDLVRTNLYLGDFSMGTQSTIAQLTAALLSNNNGLREGDQLSFIQYIQNTSSDGNYTITCRAYEIILSLTSTELVSTYFPIDIISESGDDNSALSATINTFVGGVAFIVSRTVGGRILVSSSSITLTPGNTVYAVMTTASQRSTALRSYGTNTMIFLDSTSAGTANSSVATEIRILSISINGRSYAPGATLPSSISEEAVITINLSQQVDAAQEIGARFTAGSGNDYWTLTNTMSASAVPQTTLTYSASEDYNMTGDGTWNLIIFRGQDSTQPIASASFQAYDNGGNGEGLG